MKFLSILSLFVATLGACAAQTAPETPDGAKSAAIMQKVFQLDAMIQILPLALTKDQIKAILPVIEKTRQLRLDILKAEDGDIAKIGPDVEKATDDGLTKGVYPPRDLQIRIAKLTTAMSLRRAIARGEWVDMIYSVLDKTLNAGQKKVMEKSLDEKKLDPNLKPDKMTSEQKIKFFVGFVFLDRNAYDVLVKMSM